MSQAMDDLEEEQESNGNARIGMIEKIIESHSVDSEDKGYYSIIPRRDIEGIAYEIEQLYEQALEEADTLSREQIIKIIRGTQPTEEQVSLTILISYNGYYLYRKEDKVWIWVPKLIELPDEELYAIFSIIRNNPV